MIDPITQYILDEQTERRVSLLEDGFTDILTKPDSFFSFVTGDSKILTNKEFNTAMEKSHLSGLEKAVGNTDYQSGFDVGKETGLYQGIRQGTEQGIRQGVEQGVEQGKRETMTLFAVLAVVGLITAVGVVVYRKYFSRAARACENKKGKEKDLCMLKYRMEGLTKKATTLSGNARTHCSKSKNVGKCKAIIAKKINSINNDVNKIKNKIQEMGRR